MAQRTYFPSKAPESTDWPVPPGAAYLAVKLDTIQVGFVSISVDTLPEGLGVQQITRIDLPGAAGHQRRLLIRTTGLLTRSLRLRSWQYTVLDGDVQTAVNGRVDGDTLLTLVNQWANGADTLVTPLGRSLLLPVALPFAVMRLRPLEAGRVYRTTVVDPASLELEQVTVRVDRDSLFSIPDSAEFESSQRRWIPAHRDTVRAWRLETLEHGLPMVRWIDAQGLPVWLGTPLGLSFERSAFELVTLNYRNHPAPAGVWPSGVGLAPQALSSGPTPAAGPLRARLERAGGALPVPLDSLAALRGGEQRVAGDTVFVNRVPIGAPASIPDSLTGPSYLGDAPLLELKDPQMQALARQLTAADPARTAGRIGDWVNRNVGLDAPSPVRPGAGYTVRYRRGDPGTRALLFISLARAAGLPARLASGLVPSPNGFYFGSWPEVLLGDWVPVDLEAGRLPADPSRIRLMVGGAGRADELVPLLGAIRLQVLPPPLQAP